MAEEDLHETCAYRIREKFESREIFNKLSTFGQMRQVDQNCYRFIPQNPDWPNALIYGDGRIYVLKEKHFNEEIETFVHELSELIGMEIYDCT